MTATWTAADQAPSTPTSSLPGLSISKDAEMAQRVGPGGSITTSHSQESPLATPRSQQETILVTKRDGRLEPLDGNKILSRMESLFQGLDSRYVSPQQLTESVMRGMYPNVTSEEIYTLAAETAASMSTQHPDYARLAARICISQNHKVTQNTFSDAMEILFDEGNGFINKGLSEFVRRHAEKINQRIVHQRDHNLTYFGFKTLERAYLLKTDKGEIVERPQYLLMRVALGIHCCGSIESEEKQLEDAFETYDMMSQGYFTHASPTLFHAGTTHPQLSSCFLVQMTDDSINGIYDTLKRCAVISKVRFTICRIMHPTSIFQFLPIVLLGTCSAPFHYRRQGG